MVEASGTIALDSAVVGILTPDGARLGLGCLITADLVLSCAHVVGPARTTGVGSRVAVDFPLLADARDAPWRSRLVATVVAWRPPEPDGSGDLALLRLDQVPASARAVPLVEAREFWGHRMRTFGFPAGPGRSGGVWHEGTLLARQASGWVQTQTTDPSGYRIERGFSGAPVWDDTIGGVVGVVVAAETEPSDPGAGYLIPTQTVLDTWPHLRAVLAPPCPYRSLEPFGEVDAAWFHGRDAEAAELATLVRRRRVVTVVGRSGCGKSSLVRAGLIPRLRAEGDVAVASLRPGPGDAVADLATALLPLHDDDLDENRRAGARDALTERLRSDGLESVLDRIRERTSCSLVVVVLDQAEQLLAGDPDGPDPIADLLFAPTAPADLHVVVTLRADFLDSALARGAWAGALDHPVVPLRAMTPAQLQAAIAGPIAAIPGREFAPGLVERILTDVGTDPGALPLLGLTLTRLWSDPRAGQLTHEAYEALGRVPGSLATYADEVWSRTVPEPEHAAARRLVTRLVRIPAVGAPTRRVISRDDLDEDQWRLAQRLATTRLLVVGRDDLEDRETVELAHDALLDGWPLLEGWIAADRDLRVWQDGLRDDLDRWQHADRDPQQLLRGTRLAVARERRDHPSADLSPGEQEFVRLSDEQERRVGRRRRRRRSGIATGVVLAVLLTVVAVYQSRVAGSERAAAASRALAAAATAQTTRNPANAAMLALAAYRESPTAEAENALFGQYVRDQRASTVFSGAPGNLTTARVSRDGTVVAGLTENGLLAVWTRPPRGPVRQRQTRPADEANAMDLSRDGTTVWLKQNDGLSRYDVATGAVTPVIPLPAAQIRKTPVAVSDDGRSVATLLVGGPGDRIAVWDTATGRLLGELPMPDASLVTGVGFGPGRTLVIQVGVGQTTVVRWTPAAGPPIVLAANVAGATHVPGSDTVLTCRFVDTRISLEALAVADGASRGRRESGSMGCAYLATDGDVVADLSPSPNQPADVSVLDLRSGTSTSFASSFREASEDLADHVTVLPGLVPGPDGPRIVAYDRSGVVLLPLPDPGQAVGGVELSRLTADGRLIVAVADYGRTLAVSGSQGSGPIQRAPRQAPFRGASSASDLATDSRDDLLADRVADDRVAVRRLSDLRPVTEITTPPVGPVDPVTGNARETYDMFFDDAGRLVCTAGTDVTVWDPLRGTLLARVDLATTGQADPGDDVAVRPGPQPSALSVAVRGRPDVRLVDIASGRQVGTVPVGDDVLVGAFDRSGRYLSIIRPTGVIEVWDADTRQRVIGPLPSVITDSSQTEFTAGFVDDSGRYLTGSGSRVQVWGPDSPAVERSLDVGPGYRITDSADDGRLLQVRTEAGAAFTLSLRPDDWQDTLCRVVGDRPFTQAERDALPVPLPDDPLCPGA